jgi:uncharacterized metal-binding protein YceD (DUF177 family)
VIAEPGGPAASSTTILVDRVGAAGIERTVTADEAQRQALAERLGVPEVLAFTCRFRLKRGGDTARGEIVADGVLDAVVTRICVVSLDAFAQPMHVVFRVRFVRAGTESAEIDPDSDDDVTYDGGSIDLAEAAEEQIALELDPYPHKPGADLPTDAGEEQTSPFAALAGRLPRA